jgi:hypothetical protein
MNVITLNQDLPTQNAPRCESSVTGPKYSIVRRGNIESKKALGKKLSLTYRMLDNLSNKATLTSLHTFHHPFSITMFESSLLRHKVCLGNLGEGIAYS